MRNKLANAMNTVRNDGFGALAHKIGRALRAGGAASASEERQASSTLPPGYVALEDLMPADPSERAAAVGAFLAECGISVPGVALDPEPWARRSFDDRAAAYVSAHAAEKRCALFLYEMTSGDTPTFRYFGYNPVQALESAAREAAAAVGTDAAPRWHAGFFYTSELADVATRDLLAATDAVVLIRMRTRPDVVAFMTEVHRRGIPSAYLIDDLAVGVETAPRIIEAMHAASDEGSRAFWRGVTRRFELASDMTDAFVAPVPSLARRLADRSGRPAFVLHNTLNAEQLAVCDAIAPAVSAYRARSHPFTIAYFSGTDSHTADFALVEDAIVRFMERHDDVRLLLVGRLGVSERIAGLARAGRAVVLPPVDFATLQCLQAAADVCLAPVVLDDFTDSKSALKVFEAGAAGSIVCASPSSAHLEAIDDGATGFVCADGEAWYQAFAHLYPDPALCAEMGARARAKALAERSGAAVVRQIEGMLDAIAAVPCGSSLPEADPIMERALTDDLDWDEPFAANIRYGNAY